MLLLLPLLILLLLHQMSLVMVMTSVVARAPILARFAEQLSPRGSRRETGARRHRLRCGGRLPHKHRSMMTRSVSVSRRCSGMVLAHGHCCYNRRRRRRPWWFLCRWRTFKRFCRRVVLEFGSRQLANEFGSRCRTPSDANDAHCFTDSLAAASAAGAALVVQSGKTKGGRKQVENLNTIEGGGEEGREQQELI